MHEEGRPVTAHQESKKQEEGRPAKIVTHCVWSNKEMILAAQAAQAEEEEEKRTFGQANANGLAKVMAGMAIAAKHPRVWLAEVMDASTYLGRPCKQE
jgi:hypothetical protein